MLCAETVLKFYLSCYILVNEDNINNTNTMHKGHLLLEKFQKKITKQKILEKHKNLSWKRGGCREI